MKKMLFAILYLYVTLASAELQTATVTGYIPYQTSGKQVLLFQLQGNVSGTCNDTARFAIDSSAVHFKNVLAAIMAAHHAQSTITVSYSKTCNAWGNAWDITHVCVGSIPC